jgi:hypothetical protein
LRGADFRQSPPADKTKVCDFLKKFDPPAFLSWGAENVTTHGVMGASPEGSFSAQIAGKGPTLDESRARDSSPNTAKNDLTVPPIL